MPMCSIVLPLARALILQLVLFKHGETPSEMVNGVVIMLSLLMAFGAHTAVSLHNDRIFNLQY